MNTVIVKKEAQKLQYLELKCYWKINIAPTYSPLINTGGDKYRFKLC